MPSRDILNRKVHKEGVERLIPKATRIFTDRKEAQKSFFEMIEKAKQEGFQDYYVMNYYGSCGIGKTALLAELEKNVRLQYKHAIILHYDFRGTYLDDEKIILDRIAWQLQQAIPRLNFPLYNMACFLLNQSEGQISNNSINKNTIIDNPILALLADLFAEITGMGYLSIVREAAVKLSKPVKELFSQNKDYYKKCIQQMRNMTSNELKNNLPLYFALDINECDHDPIYAFFDTYEAYTHDTVKDEWLHGRNGLARNLGDAVFIIAGQNKLKWQEDDFWEHRLDSHIIQNLSKEDSVDFLTSCNVMPESLCNEIFQLTNGSPLWLDLCVGQYFNLKNNNQDVNIQSIGSKKTDLVDRHLQYVSKHMRDVYCLVSAMKQWNDELLSIALDAINIQVSIPEFEELLEQPYISYDENTEVYSISYEIGEILKTKLSEKVLSKTLDCVMAYLETHRRGDTLLIDEKAINCFAVALRIADNLSQMSSIPNGLMDITCLFGEYQLKMFCYSSAIDFLATAVHQATQTVGTNSIKTRYIKSRLALALDRSGKVNDAIELYKELMSTSDSTTDKEDDYLSIRNNFAILYKNIGKIDAAYKLQKDVLDYSIATHGLDHPSTWRAQNNMALTYRELGSFDRARELQESVYAKRKERFGMVDPETINAALNLANTYMTLAMNDSNLTQKCENLFNTALTQARKLPSKDILVLLEVENSYAKFEATIGHYQEAEQLIQEVVEGKQRLFGEARFSVLYALQQYAAILIYERKKYECEKIIERIKQYEELLSNSSQNVAKRILLFLQIWECGLCEPYMDGSISKEQFEQSIKNFQNGAEPYSQVSSII